MLAYLFEINLFMICIANNNRILHHSRLVWQKITENYI